MNSIVLIGAGGHCKSVIDVFEAEGRFKIAGILDKHELLGTKTLGYSVFGIDADMPKLAKKYKSIPIRTVDEVLKKKDFDSVLIGSATNTHVDFIKKFSD